ncbi:MAG: hypothetical protein E6Q76_02070 [Rhizobium sp.]|nr:MAG: hypothetical protein E6Q76_02070 [Rhizobium sp.]
MITRLHISLLLGAAIVIWAVTLTVRGVPVTADLLIPYGIAVSALTLLCVGFNHWCWRFVLFKGWLVQRPWLQGTWRVALQSSWVDPQTGEGTPSIEGYMTIRQTFSLLTVRLFTQESSSASISAWILRSEDSLFRLVATYQNEPSAALRGVRSEIHYGTLLLHVHEEPPKSLTGHYWTDRKTNGTLELTDRKDRLASSFTDARALYVAD